MRVCVAGASAQLIATASKDGTSRLWRTADGARAHCVGVCVGHTEAVGAVAFSHATRCAKCERAKCERAKCERAKRERAKWERAKWERTARDQVRERGGVGEGVWTGDCYRDKEERAKRGMD